MNFSPPQDTESKTNNGVLAKHRADVPANFVGFFAMNAMGWMQRFSRRAPLFFGVVCALLAVGCTKTPPIKTAPPPAAPPAPPAIVENPPAAGPAPVVEAAPEPPLDSASLERRFVSAPDDPEARIEVIRELAGAPPAAALALLNRLYPIERREDVKMEMLAALGDLDREKDRDNQLALCLKALAPGQPARLRCAAVHTLADVPDPRVRAMLVPLLSDSDRAVRAAAAQNLRDLRE